jgi:transposase-like protein
LNEAVRVRHLRVTPSVRSPGSAFAGFRFPPGVILLAVRWYLRYGLSYRDLEELLAERGIEVDHVTLFGTVALSRATRREAPTGPKISY